VSETNGIVMPNVSEKTQAPPEVSPEKMAIGIIAVIIIVVFIVIAAIGAYLFFTFWANVSEEFGGDASITNIDAEWRYYDTWDAFHPVPDIGYRFLWLNFTLNNNGDSTISCSYLWFEVQGTDGTIYKSDFSSYIGPDEIAAGGSGKIMIIFEVPEDWTPNILHYDELLGPECQANIPTPN